MYSGFETLSALFGYSLQVYADFSGYTDIATGVAMLMGFTSPQNFNSPYKAPNPGNFWKRWHISLSQWLQDYFVHTIMRQPQCHLRHLLLHHHHCSDCCHSVGQHPGGAGDRRHCTGSGTTAVLKPERRKNKHQPQLNEHHAAGWSVARRQLELCDLGRTEWHRHGDIQVLENRDVYMRTLIIMLVTLGFCFLSLYMATPLSLLAPWTGAIFAGTFIRMIYNCWAAPTHMPPWSTHGHSPDLRVHHLHLSLFPPGSNLTQPRPIRSLGRQPRP